MHVFLQVIASSSTQNIQDKAIAQQVQKDNIHVPKINAPHETGDKVEELVSVVPTNDSPPSTEIVKEWIVDNVDEDKPMPCQMISADGHIYVAAVSKNQVEVEHFELKHLQR